MNIKISVQKIWGIQCTQYKRHIISGMNLKTELGQTDLICTENIYATDQCTQLII